MGDDVLVVHRFVRGNGEAVRPQEVYEDQQAVLPMTVTKTEARLLSYEQGTQSWVLLHYVA